MDINKSLTGNHRIFWLVASLIIVTAFEILSLAEIHLPAWLAIPFFFFIIIGIGSHTLYEGMVALFRLDFKDINLLMLIAVSGAFYLGKYEEAAVVIVLYNLAERLEEIGIQRSQAAITSLAQKMPHQAIIKGQNNPTNVNDVKIGTIITVKPAELIPLDGVVVEGFSSVDESTITGEPIPQDKIQGDLVFSGTLNMQGYLEIKVTKESNESIIAKIQDQTLKAIQTQAKTQRFIETFSQYYTPSIIGIAILWTILPPYLWGASFDTSFLGALTLLVIACPCALVISTPISIYSAIGNASSRGILIKGGKFLEAIGQIKAIALDKTRTLTLGKPIVTDVIPSGPQTKEHLLSCAAGLEFYSEHPLAQSILDAAKKDNLSPHEVKNFQSKVGKGAQADCLVCHDAHHCIGKLEFILEEHHVSEDITAKINALQREGKTVIVVSTHGGVEGIIGLVDELRPDSKQFIQEIRRLGIEPIMLTGDHSLPAEMAAKELGISRVLSNMLPEDKAKAIEELMKTYHTVAMVGDGVNDAPALALSSAGITFQSLGSATAIEAASIVILSEKLMLIPFLIKLGKKTLHTIRWNIGWAITVKMIFVALALAGRSHLAMAIFADVGVTVLVILNSLRLLRY